MTVAHRLFTRSLSTLQFTEWDDYHSDVLIVGKEVAVAYVTIICWLSLEGLRRQYIIHVRRIESYIYLIMNTVTQNVQHATYIPKEPV